MGLTIVYSVNWIARAYHHKKKNVPRASDHFLDWLFLYLVVGPTRNSEVAHVTWREQTAVYEIRC